MADSFDTRNTDTNPTQVWYNQAVPLPLEPAPNVFTGDVSLVVTSINGASGPSITIDTSLSGLAFNTSSSTITLTGTLGAASGGTGQSSYTKGDLLAASATTVLSKLSAAANDARLTTDSGEATGLKWVPASTGWANPTGTLSRGAYAAYAGQAISSPPTQAEVQALDDVVKLMSQTLAAWLTDAFTQKITKA